MLEHLRELRYQQGQSDRQAGFLPRHQGSVYLDGYLKNRPEGLDSIIQYFPTVDAFLKWRNKMPYPFTSPNDGA